MNSASSPTGTVMEWTARPRQMKQGSLLLIGLGYPFPGSSGRFGRPAPRFHTHPVESGFLLGVGAGADNHGISTGAPRHPRLLHTGGAVPPEVSHVRARLAVAVGGTCATREQRRTEDEGHESGHGRSSGGGARSRAAASWTVAGAASPPVVSRSWT